MLANRIKSIGKSKRRIEGRQGAWAKTGIFVIVLLIVVAFLWLIASQGAFARGISSFRQGFLTLPKSVFQAFKGDEGDVSNVAAGDMGIAGDGTAWVDEKVKFTAKNTKQLEKESASYIWSFGDGSQREFTSKDYRQVEHSFEKVGTYEVTLEFKDKQGKTLKTLQKTIYIQQPDESSDPQSDQSSTESGPDQQPDADQSTQGPDTGPSTQDDSFVDEINTAVISDKVKDKGFDFLRETKLKDESGSQSLGNYMKQLADNYDHVSKELLAAILLRHSRVVADGNSRFRLNTDAGAYVGSMQVHKDIKNWVSGVVGNWKNDFVPLLDGKREDGSTSPKEVRNNLDYAAKFLQAMAVELSSLGEDDSVPHDLLLAFYHSNKNPWSVNPINQPTPLGAHDSKKMEKFVNNFGKDYPEAHEKYKVQTRKFVKNAREWEELLQDCSNCFEKQSSGNDQQSISPDLCEKNGGHYLKQSCWYLLPEMKQGSDQGRSCQQRCKKQGLECKPLEQAFQPIIDNCEEGNRPEPCLLDFCKALVEDVNKGIEDESKQLPNEVELETVPYESSYQLHPYPLLAVGENKVTCYMPEIEQTSGWAEEYTCDASFHTDSETAEGVKLYGEEAEVNKQRLCACQFPSS